MLGIQEAMQLQWDSLQLLSLGGGEAHKLKPDIFVGKHEALKLVEN